MIYSAVRHPGTSKGYSFANFWMYTVCTLALMPVAVLFQSKLVGFLAVGCLFQALGEFMCVCVHMYIYIYIYIYVYVYVYVCVYVYCVYEGFDACGGAFSEQVGWVFGGGVLVSGFG